MQPAFQGRVKQASRYQRRQRGWLRELQVIRAFMARLRLLPVIGVVGLIALCGVVLYVPQLFFIETITVTGMPPAWTSEVRMQTERFLQERRYWVIPGQHLAFVDTGGLASYLATVNSRVLAVTRVVRHWPHRLEVQVAPRVPAYVWTDATGLRVVLSNDGRVWPSGEQGSDGLLDITGVESSVHQVGDPVLTGDVLQALETIRRELVARTGVPGIRMVHLVPLVAVRPTPATVVGGVVAPVEEVLRTPAVTHELRVDIAADPVRHTSEFSVLLDIGTDLTKVMDTLRQLLDAQSDARRADLYYIDVRFPSRAYICLRSAVCARQTDTPVPTTTP